ncbi:MAG: hypothetical protein ACE5F7_02870 [Nitrospiria bacterium]
MKVLSKMTMAFSLIWLVCSPLTVSAGDIAVIANGGFPKDKVSLAYLNKVFLGEKEDEGRLQIFPLDYRDDGPLKRAFVGKVLSSTIGRYNTYWMKQVFREGKTPPQGVQDAQAMLDAVLKTKGAIGYVDSDEFTNQSGAKVLYILR